MKPGNHEIEVNIIRLRDMNVKTVIVVLSELQKTEKRKGVICSNYAMLAYK
jgi:hypothetical protein